MKRIIRLGTAAFLLFTFSLPIKAQCPNFIKEKCYPLLESYIYNGQHNSIVLSENDMIEVVLTFYSGQNYRILVCAEEQLGDVEFKLLDLSRNIIFDNTTEGKTNYWDFTSQATQQVIVEVKIPKQSSDEPPKSGCVSVLAGFLDKK